jgi:hypothetical protein
LTAAIVALIFAFLIGPVWLDAFISIASMPLMRYRIFQVVFLSYQAALVVVPMGLVGATIVGLWARRRKHKRLASRAGKALLLCIGLLTGLGLGEISSVWRLHSEATLVHPLELAGVAKKAASEPAGHVGDDRPIKNMAGRTSTGNSSAEPIRFTIIGGSSAKGFPLAPKMSLDRIIGWQLGRAFPGREIIGDNRAQHGFTLEQAIGVLSGIEHCPDLLIIYSGHNEFHSRFSLMRTIPYYPDESVGPATFNRKIGAWTSTADLLGRTLDRFEAAIAPGRPIETDPVHTPCCSQAEYAGVLADYRRRLDGLLSDCDAAGILTMVILPPSNEGAFDPNRSVLPAETTLADRKAFVGKVDEIKKCEKADPARAIADYRRLVAEQPGFAETHFRMARLLEAAGSFDEAGEEYIKARDLDGFPLRCPTPFLDVCREVGRRHNSIVIDAPRLLALACPHKILDDHMFDDVHHPAVNAQVLMAREVVRRLKSRSAFGWPANVPVPTFTMADCIKRFELDQAVWIDVCEHSQSYYALIRAGRHDPSFRDSLMARYQQAVELLKAGAPPEETGIPSLTIREELMAELPLD